MKIAFIGAGKVGSAMAILLSLKGYKISYIMSRNVDSAEKLAQRVKSTAATDLKKVIQDTDVIFITTPDRVIKEMAKKIAETGLKASQQYVFHVCGSQSSESLMVLKENGWVTGTMHPLQAFADIDMAVNILPHTYFALDGDEKAVALAERIVESIGGKSFFVPSQYRALYHAAACIASNYTVTLMHVATQLFEKFGIKEEAAIAALMPIMKGTLANIESKGTINALTGPIVRGDSVTIEAHLAKMRQYAPKEELVYKVLGRYTQEFVQKKKFLARKIENKIDNTPK